MRRNDANAPIISTRNKRSLGMQMPDANAGDAKGRMVSARNEQSQRLRNKRNLEVLFGKFVDDSGSCINCSVYNVISAVKKNIKEDVGKDDNHKRSGFVKKRTVGCVHVLPPIPECENPNGKEKQNRTGFEKISYNFKKFFHVNPPLTFGV